MYAIKTLIVSFFNFHVLLSVQNVIKQQSFIDYQVTYEMSLIYVFQQYVYLIAMSSKKSSSTLLDESRSLELLEVNYDSDQESDSDDSHYQARSSKSCPRSCTCEEYVKIKKSSSKSVTFGKKHCWDSDEMSTRRQKLELMLSRTQVEEANVMERHNELQARFDRVEAVLDALLHYIDCVKLEIGSSYRLCHLVNNLVVNEKSAFVTDSLMQLIKKLCVETPFDENGATKTKIYETLNATKDLEGLFEKYESRRRDFNTGLLNFKILLENMNLSKKQLDRLQRQFDTVLLNYQHSRCLLDQELPYLTDKRMSVLVECFGEMSADLQGVASNRSDLAGLFGGLEEALKVNNEPKAIRDSDKSVSCSAKLKRCKCFSSDEVPPE